MITFATSAGCESIGTWLEGSVMVFAFIAFANFRSRSGGIILSLAATTYHVGFVFHAALVSFAPKAAPLVGPWIAARTFLSAIGRSWAKFSRTPFVVIVRNPLASGRSSAPPGAGGNC